MGTMYRMYVHLQYDFTKNIFNEMKHGSNSQKLTKHDYSYGQECVYSLQPKVHFSIVLGAL